MPFATFEIPLEKIVHGTKKTVLNKQRYKILYNFHIFISGKITTLPIVNVDFNGNNQKIPIEDYVDIAWNPAIGYTVSEYKMLSGGTIRIVLTFKSHGIPNSSITINVENKDNSGDILVRGFIDAER